MSRFTEREPKTDREWEIFFRETKDKLKNTDTTLSDEERKSINPVIGMIHNVLRRLEIVEKSAGRRTVNAQPKRDNVRMMKAQITRLEERIKDIERQL